MGGPVDTGLGNNEVIAAPGDSGGPAFIDGKVAAVASFALDFRGGLLNITVGDQAGYTRVSSHESWIDSNIDIIGPQVIDIDISGSSSIHADYDVPVGSGDQIKSIPIGGADTIHVQFNEDVNISGSDFSLVSAIDGTNYPLKSTGGFSYDSMTHTATFVLDTVPTFDQVVLTIFDTVTDTAGTFLDGEWTNPFSISENGTDTFSSGDDSPGGDFEFFLTFMAGDHSVVQETNENFVEQADQNAVLLNWGETGKSFAEGDGTGEGTVDQQDLNHVLLNWSLDYTSWPAGGSMLMMGGGGDEERLLDGLRALDTALAELGMHDAKTEEVLSEERMELAVTSTAHWDALISDLAAVLDGRAD